MYILFNIFFSADTINEENGEAMFTGSQASTNTISKVVNYPPSIKILPPAKSKKRGRPRKATIKSKLDIAIGKMITKQRKQNKKKMEIKIIKFYVVDFSNKYRMCIS
jgi:hypothetical protein